MHPLVARIHPSYRTALVAWFVTRALLWMALASTGHPVLPAIDAFEGGGPGWSAIVHAAGLLGAAGPMALALLAEVALLAATIAVYRFIRRDQLPQAADRATWLWVACPAMVYTLPAAGWTFAIALSAIALAALSASRHILASVALLAAMAFKPEAILLWPGVAVLGWKNYQAGKQPAISPWLTTLGPPAAFSGLVVLAMSLAGRFGVSLRTLQSGSGWRHGFVWQGVAAHAPDFLLVAVLVAAVWMAAAFVKHVPRAWPLLALPCLAWPLLQQPPTAAVAAVLLGVPFFGWLARVGDEPGLERPLLAASLGGLLLLAVG